MWSLKPEYQGRFQKPDVTVESERNRIKILLFTVELLIHVPLHVPLHHWIYKQVHRPVQILHLLFPEKQMSEMEAKTFDAAIQAVSPLALQQQPQPALQSKLGSSKLGCELGYQTVHLVQPEASPQAKPELIHSEACPKAKLEFALCKVSEGKSGLLRSMLEVQREFVVQFPATAARSLQHNRERRRGSH